MLAFILRQLIPVAVGAFLLFCVGQSVAKCSGTARCLNREHHRVRPGSCFGRGLAAADREPVVESSAELRCLWAPPVGSYGVPNLLVSWFGFRCGYADEAGVHLSAGKSLLFAIVFVIVQSATAFGATLIWVIDFMTFTMHFLLNLDPASPHGGRGVRIRWWIFPGGRHAPVGTLTAIVQSSASSHPPLGPLSWLMTFRNAMQDRGLSSTGELRFGQTSHAQPVNCKQAPRPGVLCHVLRRYECLL